MVSTKDDDRPSLIVMKIVCDSSESFGSALTDFQESQSSKNSVHESCCAKLAGLAFFFFSSLGNKRSNPARRFNSAQLLELRRWPMNGILHKRRRAFQFDKALYSYEYLLITEYQSCENEPICRESLVCPNGQ